MSERIVVAGSTGALGGRIARALSGKGAEVVTIGRADFAGDRLVEACEGAACVVSALSGLRDVIVEAQTKLVDAAIAAGVRRFIPSDFASDFYKQPRGWNRNFDLRRDFADRLEGKTIAVTSILNGAFADMLTGQAPYVLKPIARTLAWGSADQPLDFTTMDDVASYTAEVALDPTAPRFLRIAGDVLSARQLAEVASDVFGRSFKPLRVGSLETLTTIIKIVRTIHPAHDQVFPPWQGMQYMHDQFAGLAKLEPLDNDRYGARTFTTVRDVLATR